MDPDTYFVRRKSITRHFEDLLDDIHSSVDGDIAEAALKNLLRQYIPEESLNTAVSFAEQPLRKRIHSDEEDWHHFNETGSRIDVHPAIIDAIERLFANRFLEFLTAFNSALVEGYLESRESEQGIYDDSLKLFKMLQKYQIILSRYRGIRDTLKRQAPHEIKNWRELEKHAQGTAVIDALAFDWREEQK